MKGGTPQHPHKLEYTTFLTKKILMVNLNVVDED